MLRFLTVAECALLLKYNQRTVREKCEGGVIRAIRLDGGHWRIMADQFGDRPGADRPPTPKEIERDAAMARARRRLGRRKA